MGYRIDVAPVIENLRSNTNYHPPAARLTGGALTLSGADEWSVYRGKQSKNNELKEN